MLRVIHHNRWFFYVIAFLVATALVLEIFILKTKSDLEQTADELAHQQVFWKSYRSLELGFALRYPPGWQIELDREQPESISFENPQNYNENISISVVSPKYENIIRDSLKIISEEAITVDGVPASWIKGDLRDRATSNVILVRRGGRLYSMAGSSALLPRIIAGFKFLPPTKTF